MSTLVTPVLSLEDLRPAFRQRLKSMYSGELQPGNNGPVELDKLTRISEPQGMWIYETCRRLKPKGSLEIGLAYGFSTIYILAAIDQTGAGHHTALDPFQRSYWHGVGALQAKHFDMERSFEMLEEFSVTALASFATQKREFEFIYIDGNHRFDDALVDFTLAADVCPMGGHIVFDDTWMPSIQTVASWIRLDRRISAKFRRRSEILSSSSESGKMIEGGTISFRSVRPLHRTGLGSEPPFPDASSGASNACWILSCSETDVFESDRCWMGETGNKRGFLGASSPRAMP
jgi:predicted O-methyltransferase YrrM